MRHCFLSGLFNQKFQTMGVCECSFSYSLRSQHDTNAIKLKTFHLFSSRSQLNWCSHCFFSASHPTTSTIYDVLCMQNSNCVQFHISLDLCLHPMRWQKTLFKISFCWTYFYFPLKIVPSFYFFFLFFHLHSFVRFFVIYSNSVVLVFFINTIEQYIHQVTCYFVTQRKLENLFITMYESFANVITLDGSTGGKNDNNFMQRILFIYNVRFLSLSSSFYRYMYMIVAFF